MKTFSDFHSPALRICSDVRPSFLAFVAACPLVVCPRRIYLVGNCCPELQMISVSHLDMVIEVAALCGFIVVLMRAPSLLLILPVLDR